MKSLKGKEKGISVIDGVVPMYLKEDVVEVAQDFLDYGLKEFRWHQEPKKCSECGNESRLTDKYDKCFRCMVEERFVLGVKK